MARSNLAKPAAESLSEGVTPGEGLPLRGTRLHVWAGAWPRCDGFRPHNERGLSLEARARRV